MTHSAQLHGRSPKHDTTRPRAAAPARRRRPAIEGLEDRTLFALAVTPFDPANPALGLAQQLLLGNTGINITGASFVGANGQSGTYTGFDLTSGTTRLAISDGVLLTSGTAAGALPPNENFPDGFGTSDESSSLGTAGDPDLTTLVNTTTNDASSLTVTFTVDPGVQSILFDFVFGSEEFPDFVGSFNDAFAAYLDGSQVSFDISGVPVTVNNNFFQLNNSGVTPGQDPDVIGKTGVTLDIEYDGLTPVIRTQAPLNPALLTHTIKFTIADAGDTALDSGVFVSRFQASTQAVDGPTTDLPMPGIFSFSPASYSVNEDAGSITVTILREGGASGLVTVDLFSSNGNATAGQDFTPFPLATLTFQDVETTQTITIPILDDALAEGDENFTLTLANATNAAGLGENALANVLIVDDEIGVQFSQPDFIVTEGTELVNATITVSLTGPAPVPVTVDYATTTGGNATPGLDYTPVSGTLTFAPGQTSQTFTIGVLDDFLQEGGNVQSGDLNILGETVTLTLTNATLPVILGLNNPARLIIEDLDRPPAVLDAGFVTNERFLNGVSLRFSEAMTEQFVEDVRNYDIFQRKESKRLGGSATRTRVGVVSAVYEPTSRTVTLTTRKQLRENQMYEVIVNTTRREGVESILGQRLDGNYDNREGDDFTGYLTRATKTSYFDDNGDKVGLELEGPGRMEVFRNVQREVRILRLLDTSADTILTGTYEPVELTDNKADIDALLTGTGVRNRLPAPFIVESTFSGFQVPNT